MCVLRPDTAMHYFIADLRDGWALSSEDLRDKFKDVFRQKSPEPRQLYCYLTSVIVRNLSSYYRDYRH